MIKYAECFRSSPELVVIVKADLKARLSKKNTHLANKSLRKIGPVTIRVGYSSDDFFACNLITVVGEMFVTKIPHFMNKERDYKRRRFAYKFKQREKNKKNTSPRTCTPI